MDEMTFGQKVLAVLGIILCIIGIIGVFILYYYTSPDYVAGWNDGVCQYCDTEWVYVDAVGHRNWTSYIYVCPSCGRSIECRHAPDYRNLVKPTETVIETTGETSMETSVEESETNGSDI
jgi:hypothetical protein